MKGIKYLLFSVVCLFCCNIVFAANEVVIKSITPVYDEESSIVVSNENITFNDKNQNVTYKVVIENTLNYDLKVNNIDLATPTADYLIYEIDGIAKEDILKSKETKEIEVSLTTTEKSKDALDFDEELLTIIGFEHNEKNPYTNVKQILVVLSCVFGISLVCFVLLKNKKTTRYISIIVLCFSVIPVIKAEATIELQIKINAKYETPLISIVSGDGNKVGDELKIGEEHFYVVSNDGTEAVLLAKYNLEVGSNCIYNSGYQCTSIENPSGLQSEKALGFTSSGYNTTGNYGVLPFSSTNYWYSSGLKSEYGTSYPAYVYDDNSSIKTHVDNYKTYLEELGLTVEEARLIKYEELVGLGCSGDDFTCTTSQYDWVYSTTYWSSSAYNHNFVRSVSSNGDFDYRYYYSDFACGVRPVIVISSSAI